MNKKQLSAKYWERQNPTLPNSYSVYLSDERAEKLARYKEGNEDTLGDILMAGVTALEAGQEASTEWYDKLMGATCRKAIHSNFIEYNGGRMLVNPKSAFKIDTEFDSCLVFNTMGTGHIYTGTLHQCEQVAAHLNKILRAAELAQGVE